MRKEFSLAIEKWMEKEKKTLFLTGDLGYLSLENISKKYPERFINAGVAEQNMTSVAAGLAREGFIPWIYSIAPFALLRPYEQIRNDICLHRLPVKIVGNGGGFGYGIMGSTHHALEDIAIMRVLPSMKVYVPLIASDVEETVQIMGKDPHPNYLRLNSAAKLPSAIETFKTWRKIKEGGKIVVIGSGPILGNLFEIADPELAAALEIWSVGVFPVTELPEGLIASLKMKKKILTLEEHYGQCGLNETLASLLLRKIDFPITFKSLYAEGYKTGLYGSQRWHQEENGLAGKPLLETLKELCCG